ncbi:hypothetical protein N7492_001819 [Penicillium capsulatum]|uniref:Neutral metalloproteinase n=1 Tax=Penicillium capsulatum TaxID=69766 RepID=A0A9W9ITY9_9EURO|nr:hypothetical protein N7492_001819 [Penicillium capsulatum]KAJ6129132.1 hypothetical protein N7512_001912 [Penicillium capsulatum]
MSRGKTQCQFIANYVLKALSESPEVSQHARESAARTLEIDTRIRIERPAIQEAQPRHDGFADPRFRESQQYVAPTARPSMTSIYDCKETSSLPGTLVRDQDERVKDRVVNNSYDGLQIALSFFDGVFARKSLDDASLPLIGSVHYRPDYNNAFWDGRQMVFGDGDGESFDYFADSLDVIVHELTHGVTQYTANLQYEGQSGALNESISDVFACMAEQWYFGQTATEADWALGQNLLPVARKGIALRSLKKPGSAYNDKKLGKDPQVGHMRDYIKTWDDNGGVHMNSGIPNHAFYLTATGIAGKSWEQAGQIWYRTLTDHRLRPTCTFKEFADLTVENSENIDGKPTTEIVKKAWESVGVL